MKQNKIIGKFFALGLGVTAMSAPAMAIDATSLTTYITTATAELDTILIAGAVIVGAFYVWDVIRKGLGKAK